MKSKFEIFSDCIRLFFVQLQCTSLYVFKRTKVFKSLFLLLKIIPNPFKHENLSKEHVEKQKKSCITRPEAQLKVKSTKEHRSHEGRVT